MKNLKKIILVLAVISMLSFVSVFFGAPFATSSAIAKENVIPVIAEDIMTTDENNTSPSIPSTTPTLIVAAQNSPDKSSAQYICDGKDDQIEIQKAINSLPSKGGTVNLLEGEYYISNTIRLLKGHDNIVIQGIGDNTLLKSVGNIPRIIKVYQSSNAVISNLSIDGNSQTKRQTGSSLIDAPYSSHLTISNVVAYNGGYYGFCLWNVNDALVEGCTIYNNADDGIHPGSDDVNWGFRNTIRNNIVYGNVIGIWDRGCSIKSTPQNCRIEGNTCYNNGYGIRIANQSGTIISNNNCYLNGKAGIAVSNVSNITITQNKCYNNSQTVNWAHGIEVFANSINLNITNNQYWDDQVVKTQKDGIGKTT